MRPIYGDAYFVLTADEGERLFRLERTPLPFPTLEEAERVFEALLAAVRGASPHGYALLADVRLGPGRNDEGFERILDRYRDPLFEGFLRCAMLLRTQAGIMQSQRLSRAKAVLVEVFQEEADALGYLRTGVRPPKRPSDRPKASVLHPRRGQEKAW